MLNYPVFLCSAYLSVMWVTEDPNLQENKRVSGFSQTGFD